MKNKQTVITITSFIINIALVIGLIISITSCGIRRSPLVRDAGMPYSCKMIIEGLHYTQKQTSSALGGVLVEKFGNECKRYLRKIDDERYNTKIDNERYNSYE